MNRRPTVIDRKLRFPGLIWAVLAIVLARGPVPWVHTHETLAHLGHAEDALEWHVHHFHAPGDEVEHGWHVHWTLPWHIINCPCQHDAGAAAETASALEMPLDVTQSASGHEAGADRHLGVSPPIILAERDGPPRWDPFDAVALRFQQTHSRRVTLRALLCVNQC